MSIHKTRPVIKVTDDLPLSAVKRRFYTRVNGVFDFFAIASLIQRSRNGKGRFKLQQTKGTDGSP